METPGPDIKKMVEDEDIEGLVSLLDHRDDAIRENAARSLGEFAEHGKAKALVEAGGISALMKNLEDQETADPTFFLLALAMIARWGEAKAVVDSGALPLFIRFLDDKQPFWVRGAAVKAVVAVAKGDEANAIASAGGLEALASLLKDELPSFRGLVVMALGELRDEKGAGALEKFAGTETNETIREAAKRVVKELRSPGPVSSHLHNTDETIRCVAAVTLGVSGDRRDIKTLEDLLETEKSEQVKRAAQEALEALKHNIPISREVKRAAQEGSRKLREKQKNPPSP